MYFKFKSGIVNNVVPQIQKMIKGYDYDSERSVYKLGRFYNKLPNFKPDLDGFVLVSKTYPTDLISCVHTPPNAFIISGKLKSILQDFYLPPHCFYPIELYHKGEKIKNYYWFQITFNIVEDYLEGKNGKYSKSDNRKNLISYIDFQNSKFFIYENYANNIGNIVISSAEDWESKSKELRELNPDDLLSIWANKIKLKCMINYDLFQIGSFSGDDFLSEKLAQHLLAENITGIEIQESNVLIW